jgi:hypothetical protein
MLVGLGRQIPKTVGLPALSLFESPQQRTQRKKHRSDTHYSQASRKPEFVLCFLLDPRLPNGVVDLRVLVGLQHKFILTKSCLLYSQIERDGCFIIHLYWLSNMEDPIAAWEDEGGSSGRTGEERMIGTVNQIAWAVQIRAQVDAEFDRVRKVLESVATKQPADDGTHLQAIIRILEDKRAEVMGNERAGYFIHDWQELRDQVRQLIIGDPRYMAIKANQAVRVMARRSNRDSKDPLR